jgi:hypothetical protein
LTSSGNHLVFQAYGHKPVLQECVYALLTLSAKQKETPFPLKVWIYSDQPTFFESCKSLEGFQLELVELPQPTIQSWRGSSDFIHRVKIMLLLDLCKHVSGQILYTDTDVVFTSSPAALFEGIAAGKQYMHTCEGLMTPRANPTLRKAHRYFQAHQSQLESVIPYYYTKPMSMWNAGVLGFSTNNVNILQKALRLTDALHKGYPKHIVEQFAFSYVLQEEGDLFAAEQCVHHYWNFKEFRPVLNAFFEANSLQDAYLKQSDIDPLRLERPKREYESLPGWRKLLRKLKGEKWQMPHFNV